MDFHTLGRTKGFQIVNAVVRHGLSPAKCFILSRHGHTDQAEAPFLMKKGRRLHYTRRYLLRISSLSRSSWMAPWYRMAPFSIT